MNELSPAFVSFDVDRIKEFVFATHRPVDATGASELVKSLDRDQLDREASGWREGVSDLRIIYAAGGGGLIKVPSHAEAETLCGNLERMFRAATLTGSVTAVWHPAPAVASIREDMRDPESFQDAFRRLGLKLRRRKAEKAGREPAEPWEFSYLPRCAACAVYPAVQQDERSPEPEKEMLCASCASKRQRGRNARQLRGMAQTMADIAGADLDDTERGRVAVLYADVDRAGDLMQQCRSETEVEMLSQHLAWAMEAGIEYAREHFADQHQSPIVGGDDMVLFLPARSCVRAMRDIWGGVEERLRHPIAELSSTPVGQQLREKVSLSLGALVADSHLPIRFLFDTAQSLLANAKRRSYKEGCSCV